MAHARKRRRRRLRGAGLSGCRARGVRGGRRGGQIGAVLSALAPLAAKGIPLLGKLFKKKKKSPFSKVFAREGPKLLRQVAQRSQQARKQRGRFRKRVRRPIRS